MPQPVTLKKLKLNGSMKTLQDLLELTPPKKRCPFHYRELEYKSRKLRNTWSNRQIWPWSIEWSRAKANRVLPRECTGNSKHPLPTEQEKTLHMDITRSEHPTEQEKTLHMDITRWSIPKSDRFYSLHQNQIDFILCSQRWRSSIQSAKTRLGADYVSDHEHIIAKFRLKLKKIGKTTRPFRYDLN